MLTNVVLICYTSTALPELLTIRQVEDTHGMRFVVCLVESWPWILLALAGGWQASGRSYLSTQPRQRELIASRVHLRSSHKDAPLPPPPPPPPGSAHRTRALLPPRQVAGRRARSRRFLDFRRDDGVAGPHPCKPAFRLARRHVGTLALQRKLVALADEHATRGTVRLVTPKKLYADRHDAPIVGELRCGGRG